MDAIKAVISDLVGEYEGLSESELTHKAMKLHSRLYQYHRCSDPHDDTGDIEKDTTFANNTIGFSSTAIANDVMRRKKQRR